MPSGGVAVMMMEIEEMLALNFTLFSEAQSMRCRENLNIYSRLLNARPTPPEAPEIAIKATVLDCCGFRCR
jgi:hypothetical protein